MNFLVKLVLYLSRQKDVLWLLMLDLEELVQCVSEGCFIFSRFRELEARDGEMSPPFSLANQMRILKGISFKLLFSLFKHDFNSCVFCGIGVGGKIEV